MLGFESLKDILEVVLVPVIIAVIGLYWPKLQARDRRNRFKQLIIRELEEVKPFIPKNQQESSEWTVLLKKSFIHQKIIGNPSENRDFILSLKPELVYFVSQLWNSLKEDGFTQWLYFFKELSIKFGVGVEKAYLEWVVVYVMDTELVLSNCTDKQLFHIKETSLSIAKEFLKNTQAYHVKEHELWAQAICLKTVNEILPDYTAFPFPKIPQDERKDLEHELVKLNQWYLENIEITSND